MLLRSGLIIAFFTLMSRIFGLARELFIAYTFGTTNLADCINIAFKLPNLFRRIFAEGALTSVFVPMFSKKLVNSDKEAKKFAGEVFIILLLTLTILCLILQIAMPYLALIIAPGFVANKEKFDITITLCRITIPYLVFVSVVSLFGSMLNSIKKFAAFAFAPVIMNLGIITITFLIEGVYSVHFAIAYSLIISGILQVIFMYYCLTRSGLRFPLLFKSGDPDVKILIKRMIPVAMSSGVQQLNLFISQSISSFLPSAVSILSYADRVYQLPMSLIGVTFGTILLPELSQIYQKKDYKKAGIIQNRAISIAIIISIPAMCGLFMLSKSIVHFIYQRGEFNLNDTIETANVLMIFALGLPAFTISKILVPIFYANLDTKTPFKITIYSIIANIVLNIALMIYLGYLGIALGSSISAWFNLYLLYKYLKKYNNFQIDGDIKFLSLQVAISSLIMVGFISIIKYYFHHLFYVDSILIKAATLFGTIGGAMIIFIIFLYCLIDSKVHKNL